MRVLTISGSLRARSSNTTLLAALAEAGRDRFEFRECSLIGELPHFNPDREEGSEAVARFREELREAAAVVISTPEYAHGVPGVLKNALDWVVGSGELIDKPVVVINAAPHSTFAQASLCETLTVMSGKLVTGGPLVVSLAGRKALDVDGMRADPDVRAGLEAVLQQLETIA